MPFTVTFDPTVGSKQAQVITDATPTADGVMTAAQAAKLAAIPSGVEAPATTTGASSAVATSIAIPEGQTTLFEVSAVGTRDDATEGGAYTLFGAFRNNGGVVTEVGFSVISFLAEDDPAWTGPDFAINGTNVDITVQGVAGKTINWVVSVDIQLSA